MFHSTQQTATLKDNIITNMHEQCAHVSEVLHQCPVVCRMPSFDNIRDSSALMQTGDSTTTMGKDKTTHSSFVLLVS